MLDICKIKVRLHWPSIRAHICTLAVALCFNSTWRVPRDAFRYGGVVYGLILMVAILVVALPITLLQISIGQLSQQDAVGIWRAVPFFKGVGYLRLLISAIASVYTVTYAGITTTVFFYSLNNKSAPFRNNTDFLITKESNDSHVFNTSCVNGTILGPVQEEPEHYMAMALISSVLWVLFPIILYTPVKFMKKIFYGAVPVVVIMALSVISCLGDKHNIGFIYDTADWIQLVQPGIWYSAIIQALWSTQIAGGFLISSGDTLYSCTDVQRTTAIIIVVNILASWFGIILWYAIGGSAEKDKCILAVLEETYKLVEEKNLSVLWSSLVFAFLISSGVITVITLLYPLYERFRRITGRKWRYLAVGNSLVGAGATFAVLAAGLPALTVLDDTIVPILISFTTILEICPFLFIYGWRNVIEDIEFLVEREISKYWVWSWCVSIGVMSSSTVWWLVSYILNSSWLESIWTTSGLIAAASTSLAVIIVFATISVVRQVQYDVIGKLKSSFRPSRHWGPRDPITHYYWLARRREDVHRDQPRTRYNRRQLGQFSGNSSFLNISNTKNMIKDKPAVAKQRSNSDDWLCIHRKRHLAEMYQENMRNKKRSKSLDLTRLGTNKFEHRELSKARSKMSSEESVVSMVGNKYIQHI